MPVRFKQGIIVAIVAVAALFLSTRSSREAAGQSTARAQQWEYKFVYGRNWTYTETGNQLPTDKQISSFTERFNELGTEGWEYVGEPAPGSGNHILVFKRPKR